MYTSHGYHIPGTPIEDDASRKMELCGGIHICEACMREVQAAQYEIVKRNLS